MQERKTSPIHVDKDVIQKIKIFVAKNGGNLKKVVEAGSLWVISDGAKEYIKKLKK